MSLLRNFATVGSATAFSRVLGFGRDMLMAAALGTGGVADAFFVAFRFPNLFRRLFAEGAFNSAFIPLFARKLEGEGDEPARLFAQDVLAALLFALLILTAVAEIAMPVLMFVMAPGFYTDPEKFDLAVWLTRICFPYLLFVSLLAFVSGILNAKGRFAVAGFAPVLLNIVFIIALAAIIYAGHAESPTAGYWLSVAVFVGGVLQLVAVLIELKRSGWVLALRRPRYTEGVKRLLKLAVPAILAGGITQINIVIGTMIASMAAGAVSYLYYADRVYQLPLGIVGIAIGVVLLPDLARRLRSGALEAASGQQNRALEFAMILTLPAAGALFIAATPIIAGLFERGAFDAEATARTAPVLAAFALGLPAFVLIKVFQPGFFAREDTKTPMWFAAINAIVNIVISLALFPWLQHIGIAIATTIGGCINACLLGLTLYRRGHFIPDPRLTKRLVGALAATGLMVAALIIASVIFAVWVDDTASAAGKLIHLATLVIVGMLAYVVAIFALGVTSRSELAGYMRRR
ncbi:murein biosynthesis integral membrane protein MurJ [Tepidamorphus sp. 3E244]|uniref:murein biosynthesis integral membrane protein MurJ n=1 Tax=Tepidamorphus sp. 3E244 TaxID=3385498 RepID=UPI0038FC3C57